MRHSKPKTKRFSHHNAPMFQASKGKGGRDPHASAEHHAANKSYGMSEGLSPTGKCDGDEDCGGAIGDNEGY